MYNDLSPTPQILKPSAGSIKELPRLMGTFPAHNNEQKSGGYIGLFISLPS